MTKEDFEGTNLHLSRGRNRQIKWGLRGRKVGEAGDLNVLLRHRDAGCVGVGSEEEKGDDGASTNSAQVSLAFRPSVRQSARLRCDQHRGELRGRGVQKRERARSELA